MQRRTLARNGVVPRRSRREEAQCVLRRQQKGRREEDERVHGEAVSCYGRTGLFRTFRVFRPILSRAGYACCA